MTGILEKNKVLWKDKAYRTSVLWGLFFLAFSIFLYYALATYASDLATTQARDLFLDVLPTINVTAIFVWGALAMILFTVGVVLKKPKTLPFVLKSSASFIIIRSLFFSMTHLGLYPDYIRASSIIKEFNFGGDLFFSGHTGFTFLMGLIFWENKKLRLTYIFASIIFGASVLFGHLHYSIDVFAAFFITDSINRLNQRFFKKDFLRTKEI